MDESLSKEDICQKEKDGRVVRKLEERLGGYIGGNITISGYPKMQETFARVCGYCEQNDIHSPHATVYESLLYSAWLRLSGEINSETRKTTEATLSNIVNIYPAMLFVKCRKSPPGVPVGRVAGVDAESPKIAEGIAAGVVEHPG
ncbi:hypothetical protein Fmac_021879 [Flemingia macrophylla]|uniref:Uncharacterized protein n=1 Tax=Flemingia macrophylla TaxID=520843 RepID=A0ABD1LY42_9FABA